MTSLDRLLVRVGSLSGFIVLMVVSLLSCVMRPNVIIRCSGSIRAKAAGDISELSATLEQYKSDNGRYPTTVEGLEALHVRLAGSTGWHGPYLIKEVPLDPWGNPYQYERTGARGESFSITSYGADGRLGGDGNDADITNE